MTGSIAMKKRPQKPRHTTKRSERVHGLWARNHASREVLIPLRSALFRAILGSCIALLPVVLCLRAEAHLEHLHGLVLAVEPAKNEAVVRHDVFGSMPGMTMTFQVLPLGSVQRLQPGQTINAVVDTTREPWTLSDLHVLSTENLTELTEKDQQPHHAVRNVKALALGSLVPNTPFIDQAGLPFTFSMLRGKDIVLAFMYTRCRDGRMCPLISSKFHRLQDVLAALPGARKTHLVEISLDPGFDTSSVLERYGKLYAADPKRWTFLTGDLDRTLDFAAQFDVSALPDPRYGIVHSERTVLLDDTGTVRRLIDETSWSPEEIVAQLQAMHHEASNPFLRLNLWLSSQAATLCGDRAAAFSGVTDLLVVLALFAGLGWLLYRLARGIFA
jgi:protein SCO1